MDYVTRQFINLTKKFRKELHKYSSDLNSALHKLTEEIRESHQAAERKQSITPEITSHIHLPESIEIHKSQADAKTERGYQKATLWISALTLAAIAIYAVLVYLQYQEMIDATGTEQQALVETRRNRLQSEKSLKATIDQFHLDQRAWIGVNIFTDKERKVHHTMGESMVIPFQLINTGKTPAVLKDGIMQCKLLDISHDLPPEPPPVHGYRFERAIVFPNQDHIYPTQVVDDNGVAQTLDRAIAEKFAKSTLQIETIGFVNYDDVFGCHHWVKFCYLTGASRPRKPTSQERRCIEANDTDKDPCNK